MESETLVQHRSVAAVLDRGISWIAAPMGTAIVALGITQIISWGTTLYALGVLGGPIARDTGWSPGLVFGGLTLGLLVAGAVSAPIGRAIDRHGARKVMALGSLLAALGLAALALAHDPYVYLGAWVVVGLAMRMTLYDAAFAALVQVTPARGRRAISYLTLFGGFASSVFWPIGHWLEAAHGWRTTFMVFAAINLLVCLPLHWWGLERREDDGVAAPAPQERMAGPEPPLEGRQRLVGMALFALIMSVSAFMIGALAVHLIPIIEAAGVGLETAVVLASLKGVAQVAGRIWEIVFAPNLKPLNLGRVAVGLFPLAFAALVFGGAGFATALTFTLLFGIGNGLTTIVRGAVPLALFGARGYGEVLGLLATPYLVLNALAPAAFAVIVESFGYATGTAVLLVCALLALAAMELMGHWYRRRQ